MIATFWGSLSRREPEDLSSVPTDVLLIRLGVAGLRLEERLIDEPQHHLLGGTASPDESGRDVHPPLEADAEHTAVQQLVVERAEAERVLDGVGPVEGPPTDVSGVERDGRGVDSPV